MRIFLLSSLIVLSSAVITGQQWPAFRGANASGVADGQPTVSNWNVETGEHLRWKTPVPGVAVSSPVVWGDRIFVSTAEGSDPKAGIRTGLYGDVEPVNDQSRHTWSLYALDKRTGRVLWNRIAYAGTPKTKRHPKSSQASATPVTDGRRVIVSFGSEGLYAYDVNGTPLWTRDLGTLNAGWFYDPDYEWGIGSSPIIWRDLVIVQCDIQKGSFLAAFNVATGAPAWRTPREEIPSWSTPTIFDANGRPELVTQATTFTRGYEPATGKELWRYSGNSEIAIPTPVVAGNLVIVTNGYRGVQPIFAIRPGATGDITLKADEVTNSAIAWSAKRGGPYIPTPLVYRDQLYVLQTSGVIASYEIASGKRLYETRLGDGGAFSASPIAADGKVYFASEDGDVFVVRAGPNYELLAKNGVGEVLMATPAVSDGVIIFRGLKHVFAFGAPPAPDARKK